MIRGSDSTIKFIILKNFLKYESIDMSLGTSICKIPSLLRISLHFSKKFLVLQYALQPDLQQNIKFIFKISF